MGCEGFDGVEQGESTAARDAEATNRGTDDEDEDRGYVWLCEPVAPPLERESVAGGDRGVEPTVFVWIVASYIEVTLTTFQRGATATTGGNEYDSSGPRTIAIGTE